MTVDSLDIVKLPLACDSLQAYLMDESLLIFSKNTQKVYGLEKESATLFLEIDMLCKMLSFEEIAERFPDVNSSLLRQMFDLAKGSEGSDKLAYEPDIKIGNYIKDNLPRVYYRVDNIVFAVHYPTEMFYKRFHPVFKHLQIEQPKNERMVSVDFIENGGNWEIRWNDIVVDMLIPEEQLATFLQEKMMTASYQAHSYLISLHAASVEKNGKVVIFPAIAGSGKTTLTAALIQNGFSLFSDENTSLDFEGTVHPLPFCMNIKEGSWDVLKAIYPNLKDRDVHYRFDGQKIRFLPPENMHEGRKKATHLVFPKYTPGAKTSVIPLNANETLLKIREASYQVQENMDVAKFERILENLVAIPKYALEYSDLDEAIAAINALLQS